MAVTRGMLVRVLPVVVVVLLLLLCGAAAAAARHPRSRIGARIAFQAHSYNDMRSWPQLFRKGATHLKVDPNFMGPAFCATQARDARRDPRGCFVLNHNNPSVLSRRLDYNTSDDLLALLADRDGPLRPYLTRPHVRVAFALCFKNIPFDVCGGGPAATHWAGLVDDLVAAYLALLRRDPALNVEFVLDSGVPQDCFAPQRWRPLVATSGDWPAAFTSNDAARGYDRWQVLNGKWGLELGQRWFSTYADAHWGKFVNSSRAFQVWEPCDQKEFLAASDVYIGAGVDHPQGLKFAINVDVAMSEVYTSSRTGRGFNRLVAGPGASAARLVALATNSTAAADGNGADLLLYTFLGSDGETVQYATSAATVAANSATAARPLPGWPAKAGAPTSLSVAHDLLAAVAADADLQVYALVGDVLTRVGERTRLSTPVGASHVAASAVASLKTGGPTETLDMVQLYVDAGGDLLAQLWSVAPTNVSRTGVPLTLAHGCAATVSGDVVAQRQAGDGTVTIVALYDDSELRVAMANVSAVSNASASSSSFAAAAAVAGGVVGVGHAPSLALRVSDDGESVYVAATFVDAFCPNNEKQNKQTHPASCDQTPVSIPGVLGYAMGPVSSWWSMVDSGAAFSACSDTPLLHGAFSQGSGTPSVAVVRGADGVAPVVACVHGVYNGTDPHVCGMPEVPAADGRHRRQDDAADGGRAGGVVLDGWSFAVP